MGVPGPSAERHHGKCRVRQTPPGDAGRGRVRSVRRGVCVHPPNVRVPRARCARHGAGLLYGVYQHR